MVTLGFELGRRAPESILLPINSDILKKYKKRKIHKISEIKSNKDERCTVQEDDSITEIKGTP